MERADAETRFVKLCQIVDLVAATGQPETLYRALDEAFASVIGHRLFTLMVFDGCTYEAERAGKVLVVLTRLWQHRPRFPRVPDA